MPSSTTVIAARVPNDVAHELRQHAAHKGLTMSDIVAASVRQALAHREIEAAASPRTVESR